MKKNSAKMSDRGVRSSKKPSKLRHLFKQKLKSKLTDRVKNEFRKELNEKHPANKLYLEAVAETKGMSARESEMIRRNAKHNEDKSNLAELLAGVTPKNSHSETDWGEPQGEEAW